MTAGRIILLIVGIIIALIALGLLVGGAALTIAYATQRDDDGYFTSPRYDLQSDGYALVSEDVDIASRPGDWWPSDLASVRFTVESENGAPVFIGIGPSDDVDDYLSGVALDRIVTLGEDEDDVEYESSGGGAPAAAPGAQAFWEVSADGAGEQTLTWEVDSGTWTVVVMNADASSPVTVETTVGGKVDILLPIGIGMIIGGLAAGVVAAILMALATRQSSRTDGAMVSRTTQPGVMPGAVVAGGGTGAVLGAAAIAARPSVYPVTFEGVMDGSLSRWLWLVKWILAIPHYIVLWFLWVAFIILTIVAFFAILFTGRYPKGIFDFNVGVLRWTWRVGFYSFSALGTDKYPPFSLEDSDYPARLNVEYPERLSRGLVLVKWWLLAIPHYLVVGLLTNGLVWWAGDFGDGDGALQFGGGLISLLVLIGAIALLFTGKYPRDLFNLVVGLNRWVYRVAAYATLMRDEYPPFRLDIGEREPGYVASQKTIPA